MASNISKVNNIFLEIHNILTEKNDDIKTIEATRSKTKIFEPLIHNSGIAGKVPSNNTINPNDYYSILDLV